MHKLQTNNDTYSNLKTELNRTEQKILKYVESMQPVCRKVIKLNTSSVRDSTINKNIRKLLDKKLLENNTNGGLKLTDKGLAQVS